MAVHHRCITATASLAVFRGSALRDGPAWLSQNPRLEESVGEESGLQAC